MTEALRLAHKGLYTTRSNPRVGCVIVREKKIIGQGFHAYPGEAHAEINALNSIADTAEDATLYVTLEPCAHHGKTPPCIDALIAANLKKVVIATLDPNPLVNGKGIDKLHENNIKTKINIMQSEAAELNKGFIHRFTMNRPYVTVKSAISLDGKTALNSGESKWISSEHSRNDVQKLRARSCAILTGISTVLNDDPFLNVRLNKWELGLTKSFNQPKKVILDTHLRISENSKIFRTADEVIIYTCSKDKTKRTRLNDLNIEIVTVEQEENKVSLRAVFQDLTSKGFNEILVEAGSTLVGNLFEKKYVDELIVYMAPHLMGNSSYGIADISSIKTMQDRIQLNIQEFRKIGQDLKLIFKPQYI